MVSRFVTPNVTLSTTLGYASASNTNHPLQFGLFAALLLCGVALLGVPDATQNTRSAQSELVTLLGATPAGAPVARNRSD